MPDLTAKRTLVKSPPELWEELSEVERLAKHFGAFGEIKITKLEPEHTVAWEGEHGSGTVSIEPSGWGTKVTLHAELSEAPEASTAEPEEPKAPTAEREEPEAAAEPESAPEASEPEPQPEATQPAPVVTESEQNADESGSDVADAVLAEEPVLVEAVSLPEPEPRRRGFLAWLFRNRTAPPESPPTPVSTAPPVTEAEPVVAEAEPVVTEAGSPATEAEASGTEPVAVEDAPVADEDEPEADEAEDEPEADEAEDERELVEVVEDGCEPEDQPLDSERARVVLDEALDALGAAHHRPFSRG
jgi:hypothetical protein